MIEDAIRIIKAAVETRDGHEEEGGENVCHVMLGATYNDMAGESKIKPPCATCVSWCARKRDAENVTLVTIDQESMKNPDSSNL